MQNKYLSYALGLDWKIYVVQINHNVLVAEYLTCVFSAASYSQYLQQALTHWTN